MKTIIVLAVIAVAAWWGMGWLNKKADLKRAAEQARETPLKYTKSLQADEKKAEDVAQKMNQSIERTSHEVGQGLKEAEGQQQ